MQPSNQQVIRFNPLKLLLMFVPVALLVALSLWLNFDSWRHADPWVFAMYGAIACFVLVGCVVMPYRLYLRLTPEGLSIGNLTGSRFYLWSEVRDFRVVRKTMNAIPAGNMVVFDLAEESPKLTTAQRLASKINGYHVSFIAVFSLSAEEVADLLNAWQQRYGAAARQP